MTSSLATAARSDIPAARIENVLSIANRELFWAARYLNDSPFLEHLPFLFWLVSDLRPHRTAATGLDKGVGHFAVCQAIEKLGIESVCHGFGSWDDGRIPQALRDHQAEHYEDFSRLYQASTRDAADRLDEKSVDLLLIEEDLSEDLLDTLRDKWLSRMSDGGAVLLAGTEAGLESGVRDRVLALRQAHPNFLFPHGGGLLLLLAGPPATERLRILTATSDRTPGYRQILHMFRRLGGHYAKDMNARRERARADAAEAELDRLRSDSIRAGLLADAAAQDAEIARLSAENTAHRQKAQNLFEQLDRKDAAEALLRNQALCEIVERDNRIAALASEAEDLRQRLDIAAQDPRLAQLSAEVERLRADSVSLKETIKERIGEIARLTARIAQQEEAMGRGNKAHQATLAERQDLERKVGILREKQEKDALRVTRLTARLDQTTAALAAERRQAKAQVAKIAAQRDAARQYCQDLLASTSWKMSAPVRMAGRLLRRMRGTQA